MINLEKDTPVEYSKQSRDYQVFVFLFNALFNQIKMYTDLIKNIWTDMPDTRLLDLRSYTLNFIPKFDWDNNDLLGVTNCFKHILRSKGTTGAIVQCLEILSRIKGIELLPADADPVVVTPDGVVQLYVSEEIDDIGNIEDLLRYILPAGTPYEIIKYSRQDSSAYTKIVVKMDDPEYHNKVGEFTSSTLHIPNADQAYPIPLNSFDYSTGMIITNGQEEN